VGGERYGKRIPNERERRVIALVAQGLKNSEVASVMGTTEHVIKNCLRVIYDKLGVWNRVELALWYEARRHEVSGHTLWPRNDAPNITVPRIPGTSSR
jgi:DNA-binding CsgD family transcriptional regulator